MKKAPFGSRERASTKRDDALPHSFGFPKALYEARFSRAVARSRAKRGAPTAVRKATYS